MQHNMDDIKEAYQYTELSHTPVMLSEMLDALQVKVDGQYADVTYGCGGYSKAIYNISKKTVISSDRDINAVELGMNDESVNMHHAKFSQLSDIIMPDSIDGLVADLGLSSGQLSDGSRGFSFMNCGPIDMQMGLCDQSALELIRKSSCERIAQILWEYGEEPKSRQIAKVLVQYRHQITTTADLASIVSGLTYHKGRHPATRTFQALRIAVNNELYELESLLLNAKQWLRPGGRLVIVSFHSLEDRMVKNDFKSWSLNTRVFPTDKEIRNNPRARSAKLRWGQK
jgi:16S rRNA (cytosine1402-N4)-methyltransferase